MYLDLNLFALLITAAAKAKPTRFSTWKVSTMDDTGLNYKLILEGGSVIVYLIWVQVTY